MVSVRDTATLLSILGDGRSLETCAASFTATFQRPLQFKACFCIVLLQEASVRAFAIGTGIELPLPGIVCHRRNVVFRKLHFNRVE
ncbi:hypothetical protein R1sor_002415 [Riccia sorocarpa]|uniref:Uncharacterized protein n=1 Tax=Riccia sorocarpa TaxID=122646 RepID=A0ABD3GYR8_9MARC